ncbi:DUF397 domain-containing protein [Streptomyces mayteni]
MSLPSWQKSSFSGNDGNKDCLELGSPAGQAAALRLRESDDPGTVLTTTPARLAALLTAVKRGRA